MEPRTVVIWTCVLLFVATAIVTLLALTGKIIIGGPGKYHHYYLRLLFGALILEVIGASTLVYKDSFDPGTGEKKEEYSSLQSLAPWAILAGSTPSESGGLTDVQRVRNAGFTGVKLIHNRNAYRAAIMYHDRKRADADLSLVKERVQPDAYIVTMEGFCPRGREQRPSFIECDPY
jgi:hypothetical protein